MSPKGNRHTVEYDERNLPFRSTTGAGSPDASTIQIDYDLNANRLRVIDAEDNDNDGAPEVTQIAYDGFDRPISATDPLGNEAITSYDVASNAIRSQVFGHPAGQPNAANVLLADSSAFYDELNRGFQANAKLFVSTGFSTLRTPKHLLGPNDAECDPTVSGCFVITQVEFDALSRTTFVIEDDGEVSETRFDGASRPVETMDHVGNRQIVEYDQNSNVTKSQSIEISPEGLVVDQIFTTQYVYDQFDRLVRATDNAGQTSRFAYDSRDNLISQSDPVGSLTNDPLGLFPATGQSGQINEPGNTKTYVYDGLDRMIQALCDLRQGGVGGNSLDNSNPTNPDGQVSLRYLFDRNSRLAGIIDDNGNQTTYEYDDLNRRIRMVNADTTTFESTFDRDHNLVEVTDPNGSVITNSFDVLNRLARTDIDNANSVATGTELQTYEYDGLSRMTKCTDDNGGPGTVQTIERAYDSLSRMLEERQNGQPISNVFTGDSKRVKCIYPGGRTIEQEFDAIDRITQTTDTTNLPSIKTISQASWIGPGLRELQRINGNGTIFSFLNNAGDQDIGYDAIKRITRLRHLLPDGVTTFIDREYTYNRANMRTSEKRNNDFEFTDLYTYDSLYRVATTQLDQNGLVGGTVRDLSQLAYQLDGVGNRRQVDSATESSGLASAAYVVNEMNEYTTINGFQPNPQR